MLVAVCDDNKYYLNSIEDYLENMGLDYDLYESGEEIVQVYENGNIQYDVVLLDMEMNGINGIETANYIRKYDKHVIIVFITSYTEYMQQSFECSPFRFLIKSIDSQQLRCLFEDIKVKLNDEKKTFVFTYNRNLVRLFCEDIIFFENQSHWIVINTDKQSYRITGSFSKIIRNLDCSVFFKVHRGFIVNLGYIREIKDKDVLLHNCEKPIPISRSCKKALVEALLKYKERKYVL